MLLDPSQPNYGFPTPPWIKFQGASDAQVKFGQTQGDPREVLKAGEWYPVEDMEVHSAHTIYKIKGVEGWFNSVCFDVGWTREHPDAEVCVDCGKAECICENSEEL
jgi:hypothetical protein